MFDPFKYFLVLCVQGFGVVKFSKFLSKKKNIIYIIFGSRDKTENLSPPYKGTHQALYTQRVEPGKYDIKSNLYLNRRDKIIS